MKLEISRNLINAYQEHEKNPNYLLSFVLNSMDPNTCLDGMALAESICIAGGTTEFELDAKSAQAIKRVFGKVDESIVTKLLWLALLFPEI